MKELAKSVWEDIESFLNVLGVLVFAIAVVALGIQIPGCMDANAKRIEAIDARERNTVEKAARYDELTKQIEEGRLHPVPVGGAQ